ncbi:hypothetical protein [Pararhizobium sp. DWP1-1-3]|uniref:hypothetical protein n=1 Tax=Pararhizobium sp. DWP1-1-3 TaxID=2804652 RepID=UPI003CEA8AA2
MSAIGFEFDILIKGERTQALDVFTAANPDWKCRCGKNGGMLAEPPQLTVDQPEACAFVALHVDAYATQLSALRVLGHGHCVRIAVHFDSATMTALSLGLKPSTMALVSALGYQVEFCLYPSTEHDDD